MGTPHLVYVQQHYTNTARFEITPMEPVRISHSKRLAFTGQTGFYRFTAQAMQLVRTTVQAID
ncbi:hypothetical protein V1T76_05610 [Roseibium sp. FZY0029]|uniref:hypothetical protein n=1 Tax=Roseibium sp. FZY0029 TaxID=3116647 RepID=UPI002EA6035E|nr:hypothetical protein [Roseibium sp. FZY0029]